MRLTIHYRNRFKGELNLGKSQHKLVEIIVLAVDKIVNDLNGHRKRFRVNARNQLNRSSIHLTNSFERWPGHVHVHRGSASGN